MIPDEVGTKETKYHFKDVQQIIGSKRCYAN